MDKLKVGRYRCKNSKDIYIKRINQNRGVVYYTIGKSVVENIATYDMLNFSMCIQGYEHVDDLKWD